MQGRLFINNPTVCVSCVENLPRMLSAGAKLEIIDGRGIVQNLHRCQAMNVTFLDIEDSANNLNGSTISDSARLFQVLASLRNREPFFCRIAGENGFKLTIGVGKSGCAQYSPADGSPPYLVALAPDSESAKGYSEFLAGGTPTPVLNRYCMPFESVRDIAGYFLKTGCAHPAFAWEELTPGHTADA